MTKNLKRRSIEAVPDAATADLHDSRPAAGSPREMVDRIQRIVDDLTVVSRDLLSVGERPTERPSTHEPTLLTVEVAAGYLMVSRTVICALIKSGALDSVQIGTARRVPRAACDSYVAELMNARRSA